VVWLDAGIQAQAGPSGWRVCRPGETNSFSTACFAEFQSRGPGAAAAERVPGSKQMSAEDARRFSTREFLAGPNGWNPLE